MTTQVMRMDEKSISSFRSDSGQSNGSGRRSVFSIKRSTSRSSTRVRHEHLQEIFLAWQEERDALEAQMLEQRKVYEEEITRLGELVVNSASLTGDALQDLDRRSKVQENHLKICLGISLLWSYLLHTLPEWRLSLTILFAGLVAFFLMFFSHTDQQTAPSLLEKELRKLKLKLQKKGEARTREQKPTLSIEEDHVDLPPLVEFDSKEYWDRRGKRNESVMEELSTEEKQVLESLREELTGKSCIEIDEQIGSFRLDNCTILRFLRAREFNVKKAKAMIEAHLEWRDKWVPSKIDPKTVAPGIRSGVTRTCGRAFDGEPIALAQVRLFDPFMFEDVDQYIRYLALFFEYVQQNTPPESEKGYILFDMSGFTIRKHWNRRAMKMIFNLVHVVQDHNPETLKKILIFNNPTVFRIAWNVIKPLIDPVVRSKIQFITDLSKLTKYIPPEQLNVRYGGNREEEFPIDLHDKLD